MNHIKHVGLVLPQLADEIEHMTRHDGKRTNFVLLVSVDGTVQTVSNTTQEGLIELLTAHLRVLENKELIPGVVDDPRFNQ